MPGKWWCAITKKSFNSKQCDWISWLGIGFFLETLEIKTDFDFFILHILSPSVSRLTTWLMSLPRHSPITVVRSSSPSSLFRLNLTTSTTPPGRGERNTDPPPRPATTATAEAAAFSWSSSREPKTLSLQKASQIHSANGAWVQQLVQRESIDCWLK